MGTFEFEFALLGFETNLYGVGLIVVCIWICPFRVWNPSCNYTIGQSIWFEFALLGFETVRFEYNFFDSFGEFEFALLGFET